MEKSTIKNGKKEKRRRIAEKCLTNGPLFDIIPKSLVRCKFGPVVQSVSTPACHAGGRRFESVPGRQICGCSSSGRAPPCQGGGSEFEPRHPLQKITDTIRCLLFFYPGRGSKNQIQQSGGLLAAGKGPGRTSVFAKGKNANGARHPPRKRKILCPAGQRLFLFGEICFTG